MVVLFLAFALNRAHQRILEHVQVKNKPLRERLSKGRILLNDEVCRRLALKGRPSSAASGFLAEPVQAHDAGVALVGQDDIARLGLDGIRVRLPGGRHAETPKFGLRTVMSRPAPSRPAQVSRGISGVGAG